MGGASVAHDESPVASPRPSRRQRSGFALAQTGDLVLIAGPCAGGSVAKVLERLEDPARLQVQLMHGSRSMLRIRPDQVLARPWRQVR